MTLDAQLQSPAPPTARAVVWKGTTHWLGYWAAYPDHLTQGESPDDLELMLRDLWELIQSGDLGEVDSPVVPWVVELNPASPATPSAAPAGAARAA